MKKSMLYTRTGDLGMTALVGGSRVPKNCARVCAYGSVDELNAQLGLVRAHVESVPGATEDTALLARVMSLLFSVGACLATPSDRAADPGVTDEDIKTLEEAIDRLDASVTPQKTFILPGGCVVACHAHVARTVCRRAEREILTLADTGEKVPEQVVRYINRLSDYLFILARSLNHLAGVSDIPWP